MAAAIMVIVGIMATLVATLVAAPAVGLVAAPAEMRIWIQPAGRQLNISQILVLQQ